MIETVKRKGKAPHYRARIRIKNVIDKSKTFKKYDEAAAWMHKQMANIENFSRLNGYGSSKATLADAVDKYLMENRVKSCPTHILMWWKNELGHRLLTSITACDIVNCRTKLLTTDYVIGHTVKPRQPATVNKYIVILSGLMTVACKEWQIISCNPCQQIKKLKEPKGRTQYLTGDEIQRLLVACQQSRMSYLYPIVVLALSTGARKAEIMNLKWKNVLLAEHRLVFEQTKNGDTRSVPLCNKALDILSEIKQKKGIVQADDFVFKGKIQGKSLDFKKAWHTALKVAGITDFRFHDLRHTAATHLLRTGIGLVQLSEILGHHTMDMVKRYAHVMTNDKECFVEKMNKNIFQ